MDILIGADPEFFVRSKATGKLVSAHGLIKGTKKNPIPMGNGSAQVDGMALEVNVKPASTAEEFIDNFNSVMDALKAQLPDYTFEFIPVAHFGKEMIQAQPEEARQLGCDPDFNAWDNGAPNPRPNPDGGFRTASGHIHIGWTNEQDISDPDHIEACIWLSKQLDYFLGLPSLIWDEDTTRRELYGKAGCYRPKHYGMEYRTLSNVWLTSNELIEFVFKQAKLAFNSLIEGDKFYEVYPPKNIINSGDWKESYKKAHYNNKLIRKLYQERLNKERNIVVQNFDNGDWNHLAKYVKYYNNMAA